MTTPLSGIGNQPQAPLSSTSQPSRGERVTGSDVHKAQSQNGESLKSARQYRGTLIDILV